MDLTTSFTVRGFSTVLSSNLFFSSDFKSNEQEIKDLGSIADSIDPATIDIFNCEKIERSSSGQIAQGVGRFFAAIIIGTFVTPVGVVFHGTFTLVHLVVIPLGNGEHSKHHWEKVKLHANAFFHDLGITAATYMGGLAFASTAPITAIAGFILFATFVPFLAAISPDKMLLPAILSSEERGSFCKAVMLKKKFGISVAGKILNWDMKKDRESEGRITERNRYGWVHCRPDKGTFVDLWRMQGMEVLFKLRELKEALPEGCELRLDLTSDEAICKGGIVGFFDKYSPESIAKSRRRGGQISTGFTPEQTQKWKDDFDKIFKKMDRLKEFIENFLTVQNDTIFLREKNEPHWQYRIPRFPYDRQFCDAFYLGLANAVVPYNEATAHANRDRLVDPRSEFYKYQKAKADEILVLQRKSAGFSEIFNDVRERVLTTDSPWDVFVFQNNPPTKAMLKTAYKRIMLHVHPDKTTDPALKQEAEALFKCINTAYECLDTIIK